MNIDYTKITHEQMLEDFNNRVLADERFAGLTKASIYQYFQEMIANAVDVTNFYMARTAEEAFIDTARLDSSIIKLAKNLGYQLKRAIPARADIAMVLKGPLPSEVKAGDKIYLNRENMKFEYEGDKYMLENSYEYTLTQEDITNGADSSWSKTIIYARDKNIAPGEYITLDSRTSLIAKNLLFPIRIFQGEVKTEVLPGTEYLDKISVANQSYDIDDVTFSNYYGVRDPFAMIGGDYNANYGLCKVGIGKNETEAFSADNVFDIEEYCIELNQKLNDWTAQQDKLRICSIETNPDKTVRITFGNGNQTVCGLTSDSDNIYVQYVSSKGAIANRTVSTDTKIQNDGKIYASGPGHIVNVTNNVAFTFNGPITGGANLEVGELLKTNAKLFFASRSNLVTLSDYRAYFSTLTSPIVVKNSVAFSEKSYDSNNTDQPWMMNNILYALLGEVYKTVAAGVYEPINAFDSDTSLGEITQYADKDAYFNHILDIVKLRLFPQTYSNALLNTNEVNRGTLDDDIAERRLLNTKLIPIPPIFHYFDVVGEVKVDKHKDLLQYKEEIEKSLYEWLKDNSKFKQEIYKSDIIKRIYDNTSTDKVNIDVKVSDIEYSGDEEYWFDSSKCKWSWLDVNDEDYLSVVEAKGIWGYHDTLVIPKVTIDGTLIANSADDLIGRQIRVEYDRNSYGKYSKISLVNTTPTGTEYLTIKNCVSIGDDSYALTLSNHGVSFYGTSAPSQISGAYTRIYLPNESLSSEGNFTGISSSTRDSINAWLNDKVTHNSTTERAINLPYVVSVINETVRNESYMRKGNNDISLTGLNENSFFNWCYDYAAENVNREQGVNSMSTKLSYDLRELYKLLKPAFTDSILDDNNNIVNFSCEHEIPVLVLKMKYVY